MTPSEALCFAINQFGTGKHPRAREDNLRFFKVPYIKACATEAIQSGTLTPEANRLLNDYIAAHRTPHNTPVAASPISATA